MERSSINIRKCGITSTDADAVVNAANRHLKEGGGVCGVIFRAAGSRRLQEVCDAIGGCQTGKAVITDGFDLCRYVIHAVGPIYQDGRHGEDQQLYGAYFSSLDLAKEYGCRSIAFPLISSGIYGYPKEGAWEKALQACDDWIRDNEGYDLEIIFTIIDDETYQMGFDIAKRLDIKVQ